MKTPTTLVAAAAAAVTATALFVAPSTAAPTQPLEHHRPTKLYAVGATGTGDVWAVGSASSYFSFDGLASHWTGTGWAGHALGAGGRTGSQLTAVSVVNPLDVWAVGSYNDPDGGPGRYIVRHHKGGWRYVLFSQEESERLWRGISAVPGAAFALGGFGRTQSLVWSDIDGTRLRTPIPGVMRSISMVSATDGWTVGGNASDHFDGTTWTPVQVVGSHSDHLVSVSTTASDAWAVGKQPSGKLVEHEVDGVWSEVTLPSTIQAGSLVSVSASSSDDVWALGLDGSGAVVAIHWDGSTWQQTALDSTDLTQMVPTGITAAPGAVWAVGNSATLPFREYWNGSAWVKS